MFSLYSSTKLYCKLLHNRLINRLRLAVVRLSSNTAESTELPQLWCDLPWWDIPLPLSGSSSPCHPSLSCPSCSSSSCSSISWRYRSSTSGWATQRPQQWQWWPRTALPKHRKVGINGTTMPRQTREKQILWHLANQSFSLLHVMFWAKYI